MYATFAFKYHSVLCGQSGYSKGHCYPVVAEAFEPCAGKFCFALYDPAVLSSSIWAPILLRPSVMA